MPHLVKMDKELSEKGLFIIADERQGSTVAQIKKVSENFKTEFTITQGSSGPSTGNGIPRVALFDVEGKMIFKGHPSDPKLKGLIKTALKEYRPKRKSNKPLVAQRKWTNTDGKVLTASVKAVNGEEITFTLTNRTTVKYQLNKLSDEDQKIIKAAVNSNTK